MGSDFYKILIANCVNRCHARKPLVSNSAGADQCQSLKRQRRLVRRSIALAHFWGNHGGRNQDQI